MNLNPLTWFAAGKTARPPEGEALVDVQRAQLSAQRWETYSDPVTSKKGYAIYQDMLRDPMVQAADFVRCHAVTMNGFEIVPALDDEDDPNYEAAVEQAEFIGYAFEELEGDILDILAGLAGAYAYGWAIAEPVYEEVVEGDHAGKIGLKTIKPKDPQYLSLNSDEYGNLTTVVQSVSLTGGRTERQEWPVERFIVYRHRPWHGSLYGRSDLAAAYNAWAAKQHAMKHMALFLEKQGTPPLLGWYRQGAPKSEQEELLAKLVKLQSQTVAVMPVGTEIKFIEAAFNPEARFVDAIRHYNAEISIALLGQTLTSAEGERSGSLALGQVHFQVLQFYLARTQRQLEDTVAGEQIIRPLIDYNWPPGQRFYPNLRLKSLEPKDIARLADAVLKMTTSGVIEPTEPWIREEFNWPAAPELTPEEQAAKDAEEQRKADLAITAHAGELAAVGGTAPSKRNGGPEAAAGEPVPTR